ncbi:MAG: hypothetical protein R3F59_12705 [Myxococcota bacterium]
MTTSLAWVDGSWRLCCPDAGVELAIGPGGARRVAGGLADEALGLLGLLQGSGDASGPVGRYLTLRRHLRERLLDHAAPEARAIDRTLLDAALPDAPAPVVVREPRPLAHPAFGPPRTAFERLAHLVLWSCGTLRDATYYGDRLPVSLRAVPSKGARHPFDAWVCHPEAGDGWFRYDPHTHGLATEAEPLGLPRRPGLALTCVFDRVQWRYRHAWDYHELLLDLGHLRANLRTVADALRLELTLRDEIGPGPRPLTDEAWLLAEVRDARA